MKSFYLPTGNEFVSIPKLGQSNAAIEDITFLHMSSKGMLELRGTDDAPLMVPFAERGGVRRNPAGLEWRRDEHWIPNFTWREDGFEVGGTILAPVEARGFIYHLSIKNTGTKRGNYKIGLSGGWGSVWHCINEDKQIRGEKNVYSSAWNDSFVLDMRCPLPLFAFAPMASAPYSSETGEKGGAIHYSLACDFILEPEEKREVSFFWGLGYEEVAAATSAKELLRQGFEKELEKTRLWLKERQSAFADARLTECYNLNLFFCIFFSTGITLDTEELVLVTSRSPRYYVSAAYWDRDSLLWSFPAILDADPALARRMLEHAFSKQGRNIGVHSRYIDGTVLEPGFELDELMAPVLALERYVHKTGDRELLSENDVKRCVRDILHKLERRRHPEIELYATFLQPTDDEISYPYLTYDNVLVWKGLRALAALYPELKQLEDRADNVRDALYIHCVKSKDGMNFWAWSVDLEGHCEIYDEPPGSLLLLPYLGFCPPNDETYQNTVRMIRSPGYKFSFSGCAFGDIGCPHAPHPWLLSVANSLLSGTAVQRGLNILRGASMDNGIVCESIHEHTGECTTGEAFATCAGFVCHALKTVMEGSAS